MADQDNFKQLFEYDFWANKRVANALQGQLFDQSKKCMHYLAHIQASQQIWHARIRETPTTDIELWPQNGYADNHIAKLKEMQTHWATVLDENKEKLDKDISYKNSKGVQFNTPLSGILHHVIIHGQHHRAQIASLLRQSGIEPPGTDFIFYLRETDKE